jgi:hypothetical protein
MLIVLVPGLYPTEMRATATSTLLFWQHVGGTFSTYVVLLLPIPVCGFIILILNLVLAYSLYGIPEVKMVLLDEGARVLRGEAGHQLVDTEPKGSPFHTSNNVGKEPTASLDADVEEKTDAASDDASQRNTSGYDFLATFQRAFMGPSQSTSDTSGHGLNATLLAKGGSKSTIEIN